MLQHFIHYLAKITKKKKQKENKQYIINYKSKRPNLYVYTYFILIN